MGPVKQDLLRWKAVFCIWRKALPAAANHHLNHSQESVMKKNRSMGRIAVLTTGVLLAGTAGAADTDASLNPARDDNGTVPSVTVSATRRDASLQSVPVAVTVLEGDQLAQANRNSIDSIVQEVPSVTFRQQGGNKDTTIFVRGIGTISTSPGVEPTVSTVIDGVVYARPGQATLDLLDIDRVEILRGPQGTLFGKNASSGVLNVVGRKASDQTSGFVDASYYEGDEKRVQAGLSGTIQPGVLRAAVTALYADYAGNVDNVHSGGGKLNGYDHRGARARFDITPNSDLDIALIADFLRSNSSPTFTAYKSTSAAFTQAVAAAVGPDSRQVNADIPSDIHDINKGVSAQVDWRKDGYTLTSISAARDWDNTQHTSTSAIGNRSEEH